MSRSARQHTFDQKQSPNSEGSGTASVIPYERRLDQDLRWALSEGSRHFERNNAVFKALHRVTTKLDELGVPYAVVGGMALFHHGYRRFTEDIDILVRKDDLQTIHGKLSGRGYLPAHRYSKHLRDTELGVRIEFLTAGDYPGDGKAKPVAFPDPETVTTEIDGIQFAKLNSIIEMKLASGITNPNRGRDLVDVGELITVLNLSAEYAAELHPYVRDAYANLWRQGRRRFVALPRDRSAEEVDAMIRDGVVWEPDASGAEEHARLVTADPTVAEKYGMVDEFEFWDKRG